MSDSEQVRLGAPQFTDREQEMLDYMKEYRLELYETQTLYRDEYRWYFARWYGSPTTSDAMSELGITGRALVNNAEWYKALHNSSVHTLRACEEKLLGGVSIQGATQPPSANVSPMPQGTRVTQPPAGSIWPTGSRAASASFNQLDGQPSPFDIVIAEEILGKPLYDPTANQYNVTDEPTDTVSDGGIPGVG